MNYYHESVIVPKFVHMHRAQYSMLNTYSFNADGRWPRLQSALFWLLQRLGARHITEAYVMQQETTINLDKLSDAIMEHRHNVIMLESMIGPVLHPKYLLMGSDEFYELSRTWPDDLSSNNRTGVFTFRVPSEYRAKVGISSRAAPGIFAHMLVVVVPWMKGCVIMPALEELDRVV